MSDAKFNSANNDVSIDAAAKKGGGFEIPKGIQKDVKKRWMIVGGFTVAFLVMASTFMSSGGKKEKVMVVSEASSVETTPKGLTENTDWKAQAGADILNLQKDLASTTRLLNELVKGTRETRSDLAELRRLQSMNASNAGSAPPTSTTPEQRPRPSDILLPEPPKIPASLAKGMANPSDDKVEDKKPVGLTPPPLTGESPGIQTERGRIPLAPVNPSESSLGAPTGTGQGGVTSVSPSAPKRAPAVSFIPQSTPLEIEKEKELTFQEYEKNVNAGYLPAGSFAAATMISGVEAFTGGTSQSQPQPIVVRIDQNAVLPNAAKYQVRGCHVLASVWGDMSSERVYGRLATLTCVDVNDNLVLSEEVEGVLVDSDGKNGIRGHLIDRQGAKLARSLLAGLAEGMSDAMGAAQSTSFASGTGVTSAVTGSRMAAAGYGGVGKAAEQLSEFYLKQAEATMPVIAVDAGRKISVLITKSQSLSFSSVDHYRPVEKEKISVGR